jgi:hypothetical protein
LSFYSFSDPDPGSWAFDPWIRDGKNPDRGSGIRDENPRSFENSVSVFGLKVLKFFDADPGSCQPWIEMEKQDPGSWILDKQ